MAKIAWDETAKKFFETGVDRCVLYPIDSEGGDYPMGYAWNGITGITEKASGGEATDLYADNIKYLAMLSAEKMGLTIEAYTYPDKFAECDGSAELKTGAMLGQQGRKMFGLCYRTLLGNDVDGQELGYKLHLVYGCLASPTEKGYQSVNDSPEAITFSWEVNTTPVPVTNFKPSSYIVVDSTKVTAQLLADLEDALYGTTGTPGTDPYLPLPDAVATLLTAS